MIEHAVVIAPYALLGIPVILMGGVLMAWPTRRPFDVVDDGVNLRQAFHVAPEPRLPADMETLLQRADRPVRLVSSRAPK